jgi:diguanylate cyclase (GGDEF)-like protein
VNREESLTGTGPRNWRTCGTVGFVHFTAGLTVTAASCAVLGGSALAVLVRTVATAEPARGVPAQSRAVQAHRLLLAGVAVATLGTAVSVATGLLAPVADASATRMRLAVEVDIGYALSTALVLAGLITLPAVVGASRARLRYAVEGLLLAAGAFFALWNLLIQPLHQRLLHAAPPLRLTAGCLVVAAPTLVALGAFGLLAVIGAHGIRPGGRERRAAAKEGARPSRLLLCCAAGGLATLGGLALAYAVRYGDGLAVAVSASGYLLGLLVLAITISVGDRMARQARPALSQPVISLVPVAVVIATCLIRLGTGRSLDTVGLIAATVICGSLAAQQALARRDIDRGAQRTAQREAVFRTMAHTDALTGLANRRQLLKTLQDEAVGGPPCVLLAIDLDGFKNINDTRGHDVGDTVLVEVANRLRTNLRPGDLAARLGGDEFAVLMWSKPPEAMVVSQRLLTVLSRPYELDSGTAFISASIGVAGCATADSVPSLLRNADLALRFAKQRGKHRIEQYDEAYDRWVRRRTELEHELRGAVDRGELMVAYQPVVRLPAQGHPKARVVGVEALLRWHHPRLGVVPPDEFIPLAEESGLIDGLGSYVLHEACHQLARWHSDGHDVWLAVNVSVRELHDDGYVGRVAEALRSHRLPPDRLMLDVTEHAVALDLGQVVERLTALRAAGVRIALDDFGSGYSSLGQLRTLPVDVLKIDRSLLAPAEAAPPLIDVVVRLGNRLGLDVVAEGITEPGQCQLLRDAGCRYAQGALFGSAVPAERVEAAFGLDIELPATAVPSQRSQDVGPVDSAREMRQS